MEVAYSPLDRDDAASHGHPVDANAAITMLCYASRPIPGLEQCRLRTLVQRARAANAAAGITGCLVFDGHQIVQILEGEQDGDREAVVEGAEVDPGLVERLILS